MLTPTTRNSFERLVAFSAVRSAIADATRSLIEYESLSRWAPPIAYTKSILPEHDLEPSASLFSWAAHVDARQRAEAYATSREQNLPLRGWALRDCDHGLFHEAYGVDYFKFPASGPDHRTQHHAPPLGDPDRAVLVFNAYDQGDLTAVPRRLPNTNQCTAFAISESNPWGPGSPLYVLTAAHCVISDQRVWPLQSMDEVTQLAYMNLCLGVNSPSCLPLADLRMAPGYVIRVPVTDVLTDIDWTQDWAVFKIEDLNDAYKNAFPPMAFSQLTDSDYQYQEDWYQHGYPSFTKRNCPGTSANYGLMEQTNNEGLEPVPAVPPPGALSGWIGAFSIGDSGSPIYNCNPGPGAGSSSCLPVFGHQRQRYAVGLMSHFQFGPQALHCTQADQAHGVCGMMAVKLSDTNVQAAIIAKMHEMP